MNLALMHMTYSMQNLSVLMLNEANWRKLGVDFCKGRPYTVSIIRRAQ